MIEINPNKMTGRQLLYAFGLVVFVVSLLFALSPRIAAIIFISPIALMALVSAFAGMNTHSTPQGRAVTPAARRVAAHNRDQHPNSAKDIGFVALIGAGLLLLALL